MCETSTKIEKTPTLLEIAHNYVSNRRFNSWCDVPVITTHDCHFSKYSQGQIDHFRNKKNHLVKIFNM